MRKTEKIICIALMCFLFLALWPRENVPAKGRTGFGRKEITLERGDQFMLRLRGVKAGQSVKWSVGKKGIVRIKKTKTNRCRVIAKKPGETVVKARFRGKTYKCRVKVTDPPPPESAKEISFNGTNYSLVFSDEFDFFDKSKWALCPQMERQDAGGFWRDSCSKVENGKYVITCAMERDGTPISGGIRSVGKYEQTFGLYHMRFKMEKADGLWYAFWLLSDKMEKGSVGNGAKDGAELDIIELVPGAKELAMSVHWDGYGKKLKTHCEVEKVKEDFYDTYHELWYEWDAQGYRLYMDGTEKDNLIFDFDGNKWGNGSCAVPCDLILSAEFGKWGGKADKKQLPAHFYVDYVRVYRKQ